MISPHEIRSLSLREAERLGYPINRELPLFEAKGQLRPKEDLASRILCLTAVVAAAWGHPRDLTLKWLRQEQLASYLSESESNFLNAGGDDLQVRWQVEGLWTLCWCASFIDELNFGTECSDELVTLLPDLQCDESAAPYYDRVLPRDSGSIIAKCDLAYCLHWAIRDATMRRQRPPGSLHPIRVVERRRALEWMLGTVDWDSVPMDT